VIVTLGHDAAAPIIGDFMLRRQDAWAQSEVAERARDVQAELGWVLDPAYTGNGYATEAVRELLRHCFEDLGVHRVTAGCFLENDASWRLMERVGMRREQHAVRDALHRSGRWLDSLGYAMLADEWPPERSGAASMPERADVHIEESAMESERSAPQTTGVTQELLATVDLGAEIEGMAGRQLRMRMVTIEPGGVFGPVHDHVDRPGLVYVLQGTITDHRDGVATDYGPGVGWPEDRQTVHWLENRGTAPAVEISVDIVRSE
jgi:quercetin dioxygenase-like cupin family protein